MRRRLALAGIAVLALVGGVAWVAVTRDPPAPTPEAVEGRADPSPLPRAKEGKGRGKAKAKAGPAPARPEAEAQQVDLRDRPPPPPDALNVVVVLGCTLRRDQLTPYGGPAETTPFLAELARDGVRFDDVIAASAWTKESSTALFTGYHALGVGMIDPGTRLSIRRLSDRVDTLDERFTRAGWVAIGVTANPHLNRVYGLAQGFDRYHDTVTQGFAKRNKVSGLEVVERAMEMLDARSPEEAARPLFARLVFIDPHFPLEVSEAEVAAFRDPPNGANAAPNDRVARYRVGVRRGDDALQALDAGLRARGYTEADTLLVLVTDHGEGLSLPAHHRGQHGRVLYPTVTVVPWVMRGPGVARGHRVGGLVSHLDFAPTILALAGLPFDGLPGFDLSAQVRGDAAPTPRTEAFTETWYLGANRGAVFTATHACQRDWGSRGIPRDTFVEGCFDRQADPDFTRTTAVPGLPEALVRWREQRQAEYDAWPDIADAADDPAVRDQLRALGYAD